MNAKIRLGFRGALAALMCVCLLQQPVLTLAEEAGLPAEPTEAAETETLVSPAEAPAQESATAEESGTPASQAESAESESDGEATPEGEETPENPTVPDESTPADGAETPAVSETPGEEETPPVCDVPDCPHIGTDENGDPIALCSLGTWMLAHPAEPSADVAAVPMMATALFASPAPGAVSLIDGITTLYRSGTYTLSGGTAASTVIVNDNLAVALVLQGATLGQLSLGSGVSLQMGFSGGNAIDRLHAGSGEITFDGTGSLLIGSVDDLAGANLTMLGGSLGLPAGAVSRNGRLCYDGNATGATSATVDGAAFPFTTPDYTGWAHLWLPAPGSGATYRSQVTGDVLAVESVAAAPSATVNFDMDGADDFVAVADQSVSVISAGGSPVYHRLLVDQGGVTLVFSNMALGALADVALNRDARIHVQGVNSLLSLTGAGVATVTGAGEAQVADLGVGTLYCAGTVRLRFGTGGAWQGGWQALSSPVDLDTVTELRYNGKTYAMAYATGEHTAVFAPLPAPDAGMRYDVKANATLLEVSQIPTGTQTLTLTDAGLAVTVDGDYVIVTDGTASGSLTVADGVSATLILRGVRTSGALALGAGADAHLTLEGGNTFGGGVMLGAGASVAMDGAGALLCDRVTAAGAAMVSVGSHTNVTLLSGSTLGDSALAPTVIQVVDGTLASVSNTAVTLKIGTATPFQTTTAADGRVTLWGSRTLSNAAVVVLSRTNTYADILAGTPANPDALPAISDVVSHTAGYVTFSTLNAQTMGIQAYINQPGATMPDTFVPGALQVPRLGGECNIPGIQAGDVITYRAYAARLAGQTLSADTADAFQFSDPYTFTVSDTRKAFTLAEQSKEYDQTAFGFKSGLIPRGATVTYYHNGAELRTAPTDVGQYVAAVAIPAGHADYLPGVTDVRVTITRKVILIYPDPASKIKGTPDPEFTYTTDELFDDDEVTGPLGREGGEVYGNYPYHTLWLIAPDCYELVMDPDSPMFFIDWGPGHYMRVDPLSVIDPVHQILLYSDGTRLDLVLRTGDRLTISHTAYGELVSDPDDRRTRPFTPELRLRHGYDQAMVIIQAEPEINDDGGYATDADGRVVLSPRTLTLSPFQLSRFKGQRITALAFRLEDVMCILDLADLTAEPVRTAMAEAGMSQSGAKYQVTLTPVNSVNELSDYPEDVQLDRALGAVMMHVQIQVRNGTQVLDIAPLLPSARTAFGAAGILAADPGEEADIAETTLGGQSEEEQEAALTTDAMELLQRTTLERLQAVGARLNYYEGGTETLDSQLVVPYTASEADAFPYTALMRTSPFLLVRHSRNGLYGLAPTITP